MEQYDAKLQEKQLWKTKRKPYSSYCVGETRNTKNEKKAQKMQGKKRLFELQAKKKKKRL